eukprot:1194677-Prorocentrum_minimum.AAC.3
MTVSSTTSDSPHCHVPSLRYARAASCALCAASHPATTPCCAPTVACSSPTRLWMRANASWRMPVSPVVHRYLRYASITLGAPDPAP